jgi:superfamily I DNA/RNA helicase
MLKEGRKADIQGRNIGQGLISTVKKLSKSLATNQVNPDFRTVRIPDLVEKLSDWLHAETEKENRKRMPSDNRLITLQDRHDCILAFTEGCDNAQEVIDRIDRVFTDNQHSPGIKFSTIHKAKGLEAKRVFLLEPEGATVPHPMAKTAWQKVQEWNLRYVAITRAIEELVYVK